MKVKITEPNVFNQDGKEIEVGEYITVKGDEIPGWLAGKAVPVDAGPRGKTAVTNPADPATTPADEGKDDTAGV